MPPDAAPGALASLAAAISLPASAALWFLPFVAPVALWVAWSDMARMKIPNLAVGALVAIFLVIGPLALPFDLWAWQWLHLAVVLALGFALNMAGLLGAGDAKFAAAAAPYVMAADAAALVHPFAALLIAAFVTHRAARASPAIRRRTPGWASWTHAKFPLGLALGPALLLYLGLAAIG